MNDKQETGEEKNMELPEQIYRINEYEKKLAKGQSKPMFAAMFLLHFMVSISLISLVAYWYFF